MMTIAWGAFWRRYRDLIALLSIGALFGVSATLVAERVWVPEARPEATTPTARSFAGLKSVGADATQNIKELGQSAIDSMMASRIRRACLDVEYDGDQKE